MHELPRVLAVGRHSRQARLLRGGRVLDDIAHRHYLALGSHSRHLVAVLFDWLVHVDHLADGGHILLNRPEHAHVVVAARRHVLHEVGRSRRPDFRLVVRMRALGVWSPHALASYRI